MFGPLPLKDAEQIIFGSAAKEFIGSETPLAVSHEKLALFVHRTSSLDVETSEALRLLAIQLQDTKLSEGRANLSRIYEVAEESGPSNPDVPHSRAISATHWLNSWKTPDPETAIEIAADGQIAIDRALALAPDDPDCHYTKACYA
ncbi:MAG: hypothetical protein AAF066_03370 [Pseudomonadota bacterium]